MSASAPETSTLRRNAATPGVASANGQSRLGIVAGGGTLPAAVATAAREAGADPFILALADNASPEVEQFPHAYVQLGQVGRMLHILRRERCENLVLVGSLRRPNIRKLRIDLGFVRHSVRLLRLLKGGDDSVLRSVARFFEGQGFKVQAAHEIAPHLLAPAGTFSATPPNEEALNDIKLGFQVVQALGVFDIGQAAIVARGYVLAVEAAEGTDAMLRRCRELNNWGFKVRKGVLIKAPKPGQDLRLDLPAIGPRTVELAAEAGLAGIAVAAGGVLLAEQEELVDKAARLGLFLYGVSPGERAGG